MDGTNGTGACHCNKGFNGTACEMCPDSKYGVHCDQGTTIMSHGLSFAVSHFDYFLSLSSYFLSLTGLWSVQSAVVNMASVTKVSAATGRVSVMLDGEESSVTKVGQQHRHTDAKNDPQKDEKNEKFTFESHFRPGYRKMLIS